MADSLFDSDTSPAPLPGHRAEFAAQLGERAQRAIDGLLREMRERAAEAGALAGDEALRSFCAAPPARRQVERTAMVHRFTNFRADHRLCDDLMLFAADGELLVRLNAEGGAETGRGALLARALRSAGPTEQLVPPELATDGRAALLQAQRITDDHGTVAGVLMMRFRLADAARRLFASLRSEPPYALLAIIDEQQTVIASSDDVLLVAGSRMPALQTGPLSLTSFSGREYMAICRASSPLVGVAAPRWRAAAMVTLQTAQAPASAFSRSSSTSHSPPPLPY